ncbi:hypothetical protein N0V95_007648 [Ascochyta clinopodiicola]|nr:hypothetical protein N0V95_007648 [Ascochyta clinopodiicola]
MFSDIVAKGIRGLLSLLDNSPDNSLPDEPWILGYEDVRKARALLKSLGLPVELVLEILEYAQYWPTRQFSTQNRNSVKAAATMFRSSAAALCLDVDAFHDPIVESLRTCGEKVKIKAIEFHIRSRDQGWTSEPTVGTFNTSSWLEASILRGVDNHTVSFPPSCWLDSVFTSPESFQDHVAPSGWQLVERPGYAEQGPQGGEGDLAWYLQGNRVATQGRLEEYDVLWTHDGHGDSEGSGTGDGFLQNLKDGDRLLVWARAKTALELPNDFQYLHQSSLNSNQYEVDMRWSDIFTLAQAWSIREFNFAETQYVDGQKEVVEGDDYLSMGS